MMMMMMNCIRRVQVVFGPATSVGCSSRYLVTWLHFSECRLERRFVLRGVVNEIR